MLSSSLSDKELIIKTAAKIKNAEDRKLSFTLDFKDVRKLFGKGNCHYSGEPFLSISDVTFERLDPREGYDKGNVVLVRSTYNKARIPLDNFLKDTVMSDETRLKMLEEAAKVVKKRIHNREVAAKQKIIDDAAAKSCRARNLANMTLMMKRGRFNDVQCGEVRLLQETDAGTD